MASCAVCLLPIVRGEQFALDGTEVFHRACIKRSYRSKLRVAEENARQLEVKLSDTRRAAARVEAEANTQRHIATARQAEIFQLNAEVARLRDTVELQRRQEQEWRSGYAALQNQLAAAQRELAEAKAQSGTGTPEKQDEDATVQRFKMLELD